MNFDPVCGKQVDAQTVPSEMFEGHQFFFCSPQCREEFNRHPDRYAGEGLTSGIKYPMGITD
jgi:YHS domain-containing protein